MSEATLLDSVTFDEWIKFHDGIVLFHKKLCPHCKVMRTVLGKTTAERPDIQLASVDSEEQPDLMACCSVERVPSKQANAGAVVVIDVKTGGVLAASNYPSFDQNLYAANYSAYSEDENMPLFNRALQGLYTPGSTYKPSVAVAALDTGLINRYSTVLCNGVYTYYKDYHPKCTRHGHSGNIDVVTAIKWSCNIFFYDVGRRLTSDVYDAYAYKLGLGQRTGVEVSEALGRLTTKNDSNYTESLDVQAAIDRKSVV